MSEAFKRIKSNDVDRTSICVFDKKGKFLGYIYMYKVIYDEMRIKAALPLGLHPQEIAIFSIYKNHKFTIQSYIAEYLCKPMRKHIYA